MERPLFASFSIRNINKVVYFLNSFNHGGGSNGFGQYPTILLPFVDLLHIVIYHIIFCSNIAGVEFFYVVQENILAYVPYFFS